MRTLELELSNFSGTQDTTFNLSVIKTYKDVQINVSMKYVALNGVVW